MKDGFEGWYSYVANLVPWFKFSWNWFPSGKSYFTDHCSQLGTFFRYGFHLGRQWILIYFGYAWGPMIESAKRTIKYEQSKSKEVRYRRDHIGPTLSIVWMRSQVRIRSKKKVVLLIIFMVSQNQLWLIVQNETKSILLLWIIGTSIRFMNSKFQFSSHSKPFVNRVH